MIEKNKVISRNLSNILTYITHPITNVVVQGLNSKIATMKKRAPVGSATGTTSRSPAISVPSRFDFYPASVIQRKV
jgi:hypothetical protein